MKAVAKTAYGPFHLEYTDVPNPVCGDNDIVLKVKAAGICGSDMPLLYGPDEAKYKNYTYPMVIGHEFAGEVYEVGRNVTGWKVGDRVVSDNTGYVCGHCPACETGNFLLCPERKGIGGDMDGGMAEYVRIPGVVLQRDPASIRRIPDNMPFEHAAVMDPICNAYKAIVQEAKVLPGDNVVIYGNGPLGLFSVLIARLINVARIIVIGTRRSAPTRNPICEELGATDILMADDPDIVRKVKEICGEDGVAAVINCASRSANILPEAVRMLRPGGAFIMVGYTRTAVSYEEDPADLMGHKGVTFIGHMGYDHTSWRNTLALYREGRVNMDPIVTHKLPLSKWREGFEMFTNREAAKVVLIPELDQ